MVGDVVEAGGTFKLENCTYEAPEGKQFKGWAVGAVNATPLKQAGEQITITADTIIYAIWEDLPAHTPTAPVDTDKDGLSGGAIAGIVIGSIAGVAAVGVGGFALVWFVIKKKTWAEFLAIFKK